LWYLKSGVLLVLQDLVSDSDHGDEFEWDNYGDGEAGSSDGDEFEWDSEGDGKLVHRFRRRGTFMLLARPRWQGW